MQKIKKLFPYAYSVERFVFNVGNRTALSTGTWKSGSKSDSEFKKLHWLRSWVETLTTCDILSLLILQPANFSSSYLNTLRQSVKV